MRRTSEPEGDWTSGRSLAADARRILDRAPTPAPKRREKAVAITIVRLPSRADGSIGIDVNDAKSVVAVITAAKFAEISKSGGLLPYLERERGPGRYRATWTASDCHTLDSEEIEIADLRSLAMAELDRQLAAENERRRREEAEDQARRRERRERVRAAHMEHAKDEFANSYANAFMSCIASRVALGRRAWDLHDQVREYLEENADELLGKPFEEVFGALGRFVPKEWWRA